MVFFGLENIIFMDGFLEMEDKFFEEILWL